jgi:N-acetylglucosamine transport system permease protein
MGQGQEKKTKGGLIGKGIIQAILVGYAIVVIYPMVWLISASLKTSLELFTNPWLPTMKPQWSNFLDAWTKANIGRYFINSVFVTAVTMFLILLIGSMAAYALSRFVFKGREILQTAFISGMMFPVFLGIVPLFLLLAKLNMLDNYFGLITVYVAYSLSFTIFVLTGFFKSLPHELAEAGLIDGCSQFTVFWRIMLPLAKPGLIAAGIFNFFGIWNEYPLALVIINTSDLRTLPLGIANLVMQQQYETNWGALFASLVIVMVPSLLVYLFFQRQITEGLTAGALKG